VIAQDLSVEEVSSPVELEHMRPEMLALWRGDPAATVFQSPHWLIAWWKYFNPGGRLRIVVVRAGGMMIAFAPFWSRQSNDGVGEISFIGAGITDYLDLACSPKYKREAVIAIFNQLFRHGHWDVLNFEQLRPCSPLLRHRIPFGNIVETQDVCPFLQLSLSLGLRKSIAPGAFRQLNYYRRRLARTCEAAIESVSESNFDTMLDAMAALHGKRWAIRGETGVLSDPAVVAFHKEAARALMGEGMLRLYLLKLDGRNAAAFYGFHCNSRTTYYLGGFAPEFERLNAGTLIVGHAIERAINEGAAEFDFLRGPEAYKFFWGAKSRVNYRRRIYRDRSHLPANAGL
jgi:CelD/BcsL family acetyltransferase involved in cellulose biosynthesis